MWVFKIKCSCHVWQELLDLKKRKPHWASVCDAGWHDAWLNAAETAEPAAAVVAAGQLVRTVTGGFAAAFHAAADVVIMACHAAECWGSKSEPPRRLKSIFK